MAAFAFWHNSWGRQSCTGQLDCGFRESLFGDEIQVRGHLGHHLTTIQSNDVSRFYFASEVSDDGGPVPYPDIHGDTHGRVYYELVESSKKGQGPWDVRFRGNGDLVKTN